MTALVVAHARDENSLVGIALEVPVIAAIYVAIFAPWQAPELESVKAVPPGAVIAEHRISPGRRVVALVGVGLLVAVVFLGDGSTLVILGCLFLASPVERTVRTGTLAKWEDEHGLELLKERRARRAWRDLFRASRPYYVRPRTATSTFQARS